MRVIYARQPIPTEGSSLYLAGPTPRSPEIPSWRSYFLAGIDIVNPDITVFVPEDESGIWDETTNFREQIRWEVEAMITATCILFWIPRDLEKLPGFTTNIELGEWLNSGKIIVGAPKHAPKMDYIWERARMHGIPCATSLTETIDLALEMIERKSRTH